MPTHQPRLSGPKSLFRGKVRGRRLSLKLTPEGHAALAEGATRTGLSPSDYVELLLRHDARAARRGRGATPPIVPPRT